MILSVALLATCLGTQAKGKLPEQKVKTVKLEGYIGGKYNDVIEKRVKTENVDTIISVFKAQDEVQELWGSEFWGKWVQGAIGMYHNTHDPELRRIIQDAQDRLIACQLPSGYIGDYDNEHQLTGWDVWGRKYTLLGLLKWYWETGDKRSLTAARKLLDYTISQVGPGKKSIVRCGLYKGMPPSSILEPTMFMYRTTGDKRYLDFAKYIVEEGETTDGPQLIKLADVPVCKRHTVKDKSEWWSWKNGQKAYEMMSCYVGMLELYRETKDEALLSSAMKAWEHILKEEINICGSGASYECWYNGVERQTRVAMHTMETCVTFTWMQFCERMLDFARDPKFADEIELTMYNALIASMKGDASQIEQYTPLEGYRHEGELQCGLPINCCNANAPRAFAMIPRVQYRLPEDNHIDVNLYIPSTADIQLASGNVQLVQETDYPKTGSVAITVNPGKEADLTISLRIPAWSKNCSVKVNGQKVDGVKGGTYCDISRRWKSGDRITIDMEMRTNVVMNNHMQALRRGPVVLARDSRFNDGYIDESCSVPFDGNGVELEPVPAPDGMWMAFRARMQRGAYSESEEEKEMTYFCDFASAGNKWDRNERYRVWLPKTLNSQVERAK